MSEDHLERARGEVDHTMRFCNLTTRTIGISFIDDPPTTFAEKLKSTLLFTFSGLALVGIVAGELAYVTSLLIYSTSVAEFVASLHIVGYGSMGLSKMLMLWLKRAVFRQVLTELVALWPVDLPDRDASALKQSTLSALRLGQIAYMLWNISGVCFYNLTPILVYIYNLLRGEPATIGYVWMASYPFDKTKPGWHEFTYIFEVFSGIVAVEAMLSSDLMFTTMASHISMLLRLLQVKIRNLGNSDDNIQTTNEEYIDCYDEIISMIKIHQRLISYANDLEEVFSTVNLVNVLLSSVNICCVVFNIVLLEPWMEVSNKLFLGAALTQVGIICWYADAIYRASMGVADAVYESRWYRTNARCRRALLLLLQRSQKPLCFTALKFRNITMSTYSTILTNSYSYFALLYTMYNN